MKVYKMNLSIPCLVTLQKKKKNSNLQTDWVSANLPKKKIFFREEKKTKKEKTIVFMRKHCSGGRLKQIRVQHSPQRKKRNDCVFFGQVILSLKFLSHLEKNVGKKELAFPKRRGGLGLRGRCM